MTRILVKMPNWVGDCVMATPALALMKSAFPDAVIDALCRPSVSGILQDNPYIDDVITAKDKKLPVEIISQIRAMKYDAIALMTNSLGTAWLAFRLGIPRRIGFDREGRGLLLTHRIAFVPLEWRSPTPKPLSRRSLKGEPQPGRPRHMVEYYLEIARATVNALDASRLAAGVAHIDYKLSLPLNDEQEKKAAQLLREAGIIDQVLIGINPGAAHGPAKRWPPDRLGRCVEALQRPGWAFVSVAGPGERHLNDQAQAATAVPIHRLGEKTSLRELPALISRLAVLITNDSGAMHVAAARQVPVVSIFGPTDWPSTRPWEAPAKLVNYPVSCSPCFLESCPIDHPCMLGVEPYDVAEKVLSQLRLPR